MRAQWLSFAVLALAATAHAETLRCGSSLISTGASQDYVLQKCGPPASKREMSEPVMARRPNGTTYQVGTTTQEIWRYDRSPGKFPAVMTFEEGVLKKLEFEK
jgi:Protein of unknown function (DUF2845)